MTVPPVYFDCETSGLNPRMDRLTLVGLMASDGEPVCLDPDRDRELVQAYLELETTFVGHNLGFDLHFLECFGFRIPPVERCLETQVLAHVVGSDGERLPGNLALDSLAKRLIALGKLPEDILEPEAALKRWLRTARRVASKEGRRRPEKGDAPGPVLRPYLEADLICTRAVAQHYAGALNGQHQVLGLELRCMPAIYSAERRGVPIDVDAANEVLRHSQEKLEELSGRLLEQAGEPFLYGSARQIEKALERRGVDLSNAKRTPTGLLAISRAALERIDDDLPRTLLEYDREDTFLSLHKGLLKHTIDGRLHPSFRQVGAITGRMSSGNPNTQNIPRSDLRIRYCIAAGEGRLLVGCDLEAVEISMLAYLAGEGKLRRDLAAGADPHARTAAALGIDRDEAKTLNFGILYGMGTRGVAGKLECTLGEADRVIDASISRYPEVKRLRNRLWRAVVRHGQFQTVGGRLQYFPDGPNHMLLNYMIQGSCADVFKAAIAELHNLGVELILLIHDEVVAEAPEDEAEEIARLLETVLARDRFGVSGLRASAEVHKRWSDFKEPGWIPEQERS
jgi:DNA polymerase-1